MDTSADQAAESRNLSDAKPPRTERQSHESRAEYLRGTIVTIFFVIVVSANLFIGGVVLFGKLQSQSLEIRDEGPAFTARITRHMLDGTFCRSSEFDNTSGYTIKDKVEPCDTGRGIWKKPAKSMLNWYGK
jgi:hypothetical protein